MSNNSKKKKLTDSEIIIELNNLWNKGEKGKTNFYELLRTDFKIEKSRCLKFYDIMALEASKGAIEAQRGANILAAKEAAQNGLKSKAERVMILQSEVDKILADLDAGV